MEDLLDDFNVERGVRAMKRDAIDLCAIINEALMVVRPRLERKGQVAEVELPATCELQGDGHYLLELFQALLSNASKFSPGDGDPGPCLSATTPRRP